MEFLPYIHFHIGTHLSHSDLNRRLERNIDTSFHLIEPFFPKKKYYGWATEDGFRIRRWIQIGRHASPYAASLFSFPAVVCGDFREPTGGEIIINMRLYLHWTAIVSLLFWFIAYMIVLTALLTTIISSSDILQLPYPLDLILFVSLLILACLCTYGTMMAFFERNVRREKQFFVEPMDAYEVVQAR